MWFISLVFLILYTVAAFVPTMAGVAPILLLALLWALLLAIRWPGPTSLP